MNLDHTRSAAALKETVPRLWTKPVSDRIADFLTPQRAAKTRYAGVTTRGDWLAILLRLGTSRAPTVTLSTALETVRDVAALQKSAAKWSSAVMSPRRRICAWLAFAWLAAAPALADTQLAVGTIRGTPGSIVFVPIQFASDTTVVAAQFDLLYEAADLSAVSAAGGDALAGHSVKSSAPRAGTRRVVVYSPVNEPLHNGVLVNIPLSISAAAPEGVVGLALANIVLTTAEASRVDPVTLSAGSLTVTTVPEPPTISCPPDVAKVADPARCTAVVNYTTSASDGSTVVCSPSSGSAFPVGTTTVTCIATDTADQTAVCSFKVTVTDIERPVITLIGANPMTVECHTSFADPGATANDACGGQVAVIASGVVTIETPGTYMISYAATDPSGNTANETRIVQVVDTKPPALTLIGDNPFVVECGGPFSDPGATAIDNCEGSLHVSMSGKVDVGVPSEYTLRYQATDGHGNTATVTRKVRVFDSTPPTLVLLGDNPLVVSCGSTFVDPGASATDDCAGDLPVTVSGNVNVTVPGDYTVTYAATDPSSNTFTATRTVKVVCPAPTILCPQPVVVANDQGKCSAVVPYTVAATPGASVVCEPPSGSIFPVGMTTVACTATNTFGQRATCAFAVAVADAEPPVISSLSANPSVLWPPNNKYHRVALRAVTIDNCDSASRKIASITSDGTASPGDSDWEITGDLAVRLRASRLPSGGDRTYTITVECKDDSGNTTTKSVIVTVPRSQNPKSE